MPRAASMPVTNLIVIGASARAACFSAQRAGMVPYWIDLFGDYDLCREFEGQLVDARDYPQAIIDKIDTAPEAPFIYTGAMENHADVLEQIEACRPLLGNPAQTCRQVRDPQKLAACFNSRGIASPKVSCVAEDGKAWLKKPLASAGGRSIEVFSRGQELGEQFYLQELIEGETRAAIFLGNGHESRLLGVTRQLVGETFLNAEPFAYCGSIGPLTINEGEAGQWRAVGNALCSDFGLKGLFCVDAMVRDQVIYPLEVNPRYSASLEVLEIAMDTSLLDLHCQACEGSLAKAVPGVSTLAAKAYLFAGQDLRCPKDISEIFPFDVHGQKTADIPQPGSVIQSGLPLMSLLARVDSEAAALTVLVDMAEKLYRQFTVL